MRPRDLLQKLFSIVPDFAKSWHSKENCFLNKDGTATLHGVCAQLSLYMEYEFASLTAEQWRELFAFVEDNVNGSEGPETQLDNALNTCFLENICCTQAGERAKPHMGPRSRWYFDQWHQWPPS